MTRGHNLKVVLFCWPDSPCGQAASRGRTENNRRLASLIDGNPLTKTEICSISVLSIGPEELAGGETRKRLQRKEGRERAGDIWHNRRRAPWGQSEFFIFLAATF